MSRDRLLALLGERIGVDPASLGDRVMDDALAEAQRQLGAATLDELAARVALDRVALTQLIEQVIVGETWFFRVPQQFDDLVRFARTIARRRRPLRILSLPCASGEEAWSVAISLREAGLGADDFEVLGVDVSPQLIARATAGEYRGSAMRIPAARDPWLLPVAGGVSVAPELRRNVSFRVGNALEPTILADEPPFDVAFCRNLLIYLTRDAREQVLSTLRRVLTQPALVLAGQAEVLTAITTGFTPMPQASPLSYLFAAQVAPALLAGTPAVSTAFPATTAPHKTHAVQPARRMPVMLTAVDATLLVPTETGVALAQQLADAGDLHAARGACKTHLRALPQDIGAHLLLGIVEIARGDLEAADEAFARVLFLDHHHQDALERRAMLAEHRGRLNEARRLRARAGRSRASQAQPTP